MVKIFIVTIIAALFAFSAYGAIPPSQETLGIDELLQKVEFVYGSAGTFSSDFDQIYVGRNFGDIQSGGEVYFKRPGMMKWLYKKPGKKAIISDGSRLWVYDEGDSQVILDRSFKKEKMPSSISFLWGEKLIREVFHSRLLKVEAVKKRLRYLVELKPREETPNITKVHFLIDGETYHIVETSLYDLFGNENKLKFRNIRLDKNLKDSFFHFEPPKGIPIVEPPTLKK